MQNRHGSSKPAPRDLGAEIGSLLVFATGVFFLFALLTYDPNDPSFFSNVQGPSHNACGRVGALLASALLQGFGLGAFLVPPAFLFLAATIHKREGSVWLVGRLGGMTIAVMGLTVFLALQWKYWPYAGTLILTGGIFGTWVTDILTHQFNPLGASLVSLLVFCLALVLSTPLSVARFGGRVLAIAWNYTAKIAKLVGTYLIYLLGLAAMRTAHAAGDLLQRLVEGAIRRAKERAAAAKQAIATRREEVEVASEVVAPVILGGDPPISGHLPSEGSPPLGSEPPAEAPNVLHELSLPGLENVPTIVPPEPGNSAPAGAESAGPVKIARVSRPRSKRGQWKLPTTEFLRKPPKIETSYDKERLIQNSQILRQKFADFGIEGEITAVRPGPVITLYEFKPAPGIKVSRIASLADDISMALSAQSVRILAPLPGKPVVGIEIPSEVRETVFLREFLQNQDFFGPKHTIPIAMGKDIGGQTFLSDLARMPHLLCAGTTGSGKSVFMNGLICSLLYRFTPDELRMILVDPKFIEFAGYQDIPHLLLPVVDDAKEASTALKWAVREMERRYRVLAMMGAKSLAGFNQKVDEMGVDVVRDLLFSEENQPDNPTQISGGDWYEAFETDESGQPRVGRLPYIVIIIDELADLMMIAKKEVEISIARIAQKARAAGIHLVIATQRPSTDVITGLIKANLPSRASFRLTSFVDSKTILDRAGAERLLGQGDMLFTPPGLLDPIRLHAAFVEDEEIGKITSFLKEQGKPSYRNDILVDEDEEAESEEGAAGADDLFEEAVALARRTGHVSASFLQRHLSVGYNRAAKMIEDMEARGIVGPSNGAKPREVIMR